jgi:hypothetical protein
VTTRTRREPADLLALTPERFRRALWRSFLRCGVTGDLDTAVHAAMIVAGPVIEARDTEIRRLRMAAAGAGPPARPRTATATPRTGTPRTGTPRTGTSRAGTARLDGTLAAHRTRRDRPA